MDRGLVSDLPRARTGSNLRRGDFRLRLPRHIRLCAVSHTPRNNQESARVQICKTNQRTDVHKLVTTAEQQQRWAKCVKGRSRPLGTQQNLQPFSVWRQSTALKNASQQPCVCIQIDLQKKRDTKKHLDVNVRTSERQCQHLSQASFSFYVRLPLKSSTH